ncbi:MAG: fibronectin type III domain-containing protein [Candidatus Jorgensenbacteria bacterium]|nr:fibronectin type III domain-containing protein [Candidatus Jorgensenbacteria bacterium]
MRIVLFFVVSLIIVIEVIFIVRTLPPAQTQPAQQANVKLAEPAPPAPAVSVAQAPAVSAPAAVRSISATGSEAPSDLKAFVNNTSLIYINWRDNATRATPYQFQIQRIALEMAQSENLSATSTGPNSVKLIWQNSTTKTPYFGRFMRSSNANSAQRFTTFDATNKILYDRGETYSPPLKNSVLVPNAGRFAFLDSGLGEATTYYYRATVCSTIDVASFYTVKGAGDINADLNAKPNTPCGPYTASVGITTQPNAPTQLAAVSVATTSIDVQWTDNSKKDTRYELYRDGLLIKKFDNYATKGALTGVMKYSDTGLKTNTTYKYVVRAYYDILGGGYTYSMSSEMSQATDFLVTLIGSGDGRGTAGDSTSSIAVTCGANSCTRMENVTFKAGTTVQLTATPVTDSLYPDDATKNFVFVGWSDPAGICSGTGTCSVSGNAVITATFAKKYYTVRVMKDPQAGGTITDGNTIVCGTTCTVGSSTASAAFIRGSTVTLTANPEALFVFRDWNQDVCTNTLSKICAFQIIRNATVTARFAPFRSNITTSFEPLGAYGNQVQEKVIAAPATILNGPGLGAEATCKDMNAPCETSYDSGTQVRLTPMYAAGYSFTNWSGGTCSGGSAYCDVLLWGNASVTAVFNKKVATAALLEQISLPLPRISEFVSQVTSDAQKIASARIAVSKFATLAMKSGYTASVYDVIKKQAQTIVDILQNWYGAALEKLRSTIELIKNSFVAHGETLLSQYEIYFVDMPQMAPGSSFQDIGHSDTVYIYRVRLCPRGTSGGCSGWSNVAATKTLASPLPKDADQTPRPICAGNNFCNTSIKQWGPNALGEKSERQCLTNADCVNVGKPTQ